MQICEGERGDPTNILPTYGSVRMREGGASRPFRRRETFIARDSQTASGSKLKKSFATRPETAHRTTRALVLSY